MKMHIFSTRGAIIHHDTTEMYETFNILKEKTINVKELN